MINKKEKKLNLRDHKTIKAVLKSEGGTVLRTKMVLSFQLNSMYSSKMKDFIHFYLNI